MRPSTGYAGLTTLCCVLFIYLTRGHMSDLTWDRAMGASLVFLLTIMFLAKTLRQAEREQG